MPPGDKNASGHHSRELELTSEFPEMTPLSKFAKRIKQNPEHTWISRIWEGQNPVLRPSTPGWNLLPLQGTPAQLLLSWECQSGAQGTEAAVLSWLLGAREGQGTSCPSDTAQVKEWQGGSFRASLTTRGHSLAPLPHPDTPLPPWEGALLPHRHTPRPE